jgi:hypothetical protein
MLCVHCRHYEARPDGVSCTQCEAARPAVSPHGTAWLRSPLGLGRAVAVLLGLVVAADLFALWADLVAYDVMGDLAAGATGDDVMERAERADTLYGTGGLVQSAVMLATVVVFLVWFHRVRVNAEVFNPFGHRKKRGWAVGAWFVPVVNLWFPRRIALDVWDASGPWNAPRSHGLLNAWWAAWLLSLFTGQLATTAYRRAETVEEIRSAVGQMVVADAVDAVAAVLAALFVLALTRMQDDKARTGPPAAVPVSG